MPKAKVLQFAAAVLRVCKKAIEKALADETPNGFSAGHGKPKETCKELQEALWNAMSEKDRFEFFNSKMSHEEAIVAIAKLKLKGFRACYAQPNESMLTPSAFLSGMLGMSLCSGYNSQRQVTLHLVSVPSLDCRLKRCSTRLWVQL